MMNINKNKIEYIKNKYKPGTQLELDYMDDIQAPPTGTKGIVMCVDAIGQIHVNWDNGSTLALIEEVDEFHIIRGVSKE